MSALIPNGALISIGGAMLTTIGLSPQRLSYSSSVRFPAHPVAAGLFYQKTGADAEHLTIEAETYPHVVGGLDAYAIIKAIHRSQAIVPLIRLRGNYLGEATGYCGIETLDVDEERLHPFDGIGRKVQVSVGLIIFPVTDMFRSASSILSLSELLR